MAVSGWKYLKLGQCADCSEAGAQLFVPVLEGFKIEGLDLVGGMHIPHFNAVCKRCTTRYSLDVICDKHRLPLRIETGSCKLCLSGG